MSLTSTTLVEKQPGETISVIMDFANWLISTNTLTNPSVTSEKINGDTSDLTLGSASISGQTVVFTIAAGTEGRYRVEVTVTVNDGQILEGDGLLAVSDK